MYLFSLLSWWDPFDYASSHTHHHRYTLHPEGDRENLLPLEPSVASPFMLQLFTINLLTQQGRTFGKGGLLSTIFVTFQSAFGIVGPGGPRLVNGYMLCTATSRTRHAGRCGGHGRCSSSTGRC